MDFRLSESQLMLERLVRDFVEKEVKPVVKEYDSKIDPKDCVCWELARQAHRLGFKTYSVPAEYGGGGHDRPRNSYSYAGGIIGWRHGLCPYDSADSEICRLDSQSSQ